MKGKIMLVDDHLLFIEGLRYLLETYGMEIVGTAKDGNEALKKAHILQPDVILMDIRMPNCNGIDAVKKINAELPDIKIVILTASEDEEDLFNAIKCGASGYLMKNTDGHKLVEYLEGLENGEMPLSPGLAGRLMVELRAGKENADTEKQNRSKKGEAEITERQLMVLAMVAKGATYKEVGKSLGISERTVKYHIANILDTLHLENKSQAIWYAVENRLLNDK